MLHYGNYSSHLAEFLTSPLPQSLLSIHPNETTGKHFKVPLAWEEWWSWVQVAPDTNPWQNILGYYLVRYSCSDRSEWSAYRPTSPDRL
jgi:hypothetical protein